MGSKLMKAKDGVVLREESSPLVELDVPEIEQRSCWAKLANLSQDATNVSNPSGPFVEVTGKCSHGKNFNQPPTL